MKKYGAWLIFGVGCVVLSGCGGGGVSSSFTAGKYNGTVADSAKQSIVDLNVSANGTISGTATLLSMTTGAIMATAVLTGQANPSTGAFTASGMYGWLIPGPPGGGTSGAITVTGTIPPTGVATGPMDLDDNGSIGHGIITMHPLI